jgi:hypothetical protein
MRRGPQFKPGKAVTSFLFYLPFVGFGEEILYRGFIQSRLNQAIGTPWHFLGVEWGWGIIIASLLFGLSHVMNGLDLHTWHSTRSGDGSCGPSLAVSYSRTCGKRQTESWLRQWCMVCPRRWYTCFCEFKRDRFRTAK